MENKVAKIEKKMDTMSKINIKMIAKMHAKRWGVLFGGSRAQPELSVLMNRFGHDQISSFG